MRGKRKERMGLETRNTKDKDEEMRQITQRLEEGIREYLTSEHYVHYLDTMSKFHKYSVNNILMIAMQRPDASLVAGYTAWQKNFHRNVKKGEKGIRIIAPQKQEVKRRRVKIDELTKQPLVDLKGDQVMETFTVTIPKFRMTTVFDISQTVGEPLPEIRVSELTRQVPGFERFSEAFKRAAPIPVRFEMMEPDTRGYYDGATQEIVIRSGMSDAQTMKTMIHEMAHALMHDPTKMQEIPDSATREVQAESVAYTVCAHFGLDTSDYSFPYISAWSGTREPDTLRASMEQIRSTASGCIGAIERQMRQMDREKECTELSDRIMQLYREVTPYTYTDMSDAELDQERSMLESALLSGQAAETHASLFEILQAREDLTPRQVREAKELYEKVRQMTRVPDYAWHRETEQERER